MIQSRPAWSQSLNRPGGNATGSYVATTEMEQKRLSLLHELTPGVPLIGALLNPNFARCRTSIARA